MSAFIRGGMATEEYVDAKDNAAKVAAMNQIALTNLRQLINTAVATGELVQGRQWELESDEWATSSTSEIHVSEAIGYYKNSEQTGNVFLSKTGLASHNTALNGSVPNDLVDGVITDYWFQCGSGAVTGNWVGVDLGAGNEVSLNQMTLRVPAGGGITSANLGYSSDGNTWVDFQTVTTTYGTNVISFTTPGAYRFWRIKANSSVGGGYQGWWVNEIEGSGTVVTGETVLIPPSAFSVSVAPVYVDVYFLWDDQNSGAVLGMDLTVEVSRDGGSTYTLATLSNLGGFDGDYNLIKARAYVSAQPSGTSVLCRIKLLNNKAQHVAAPSLYVE